MYHRDYIILLLTFFILMFSVSDGGALKPPRVTEIIPPGEGILPENVLEFRGYSLQDVRFEEPIVIDITTNEKININTDLSCAIEEGDDCSECQEQHCVLRVTIKDVLPGHTYEAGFLEKTSQFTAVHDGPIPASSWDGITLIPFEKEGKWGFMDGQGRSIIEPRFHRAKDFSPSGLAAVEDESGHWVYIDNKGNLVIRPFNLVNGPDYYSEGLARYRKDEKFGFFDRTGKVVIEARFDFAESFSEGRSAICLGCTETKIGTRTSWSEGKWGYINKSGEIIIPAKFDRTGQFKNSSAPVMLNGKYIFIDTNGAVK